MKKYYVHDGEQQKGPFDIDELKSQNLKPTTMVWFEGMQDWKAAKDVDELNQLFKSIPPPIKKEVPPSFTGNPIPNSANNQNNVAQKRATTLLFIWELLLQF